MSVTVKNTGAGRITIREVASHAGVNASTVSRALNPETRHLIGDEVAARVLASAKTLGYRQNIFAAGLKGGASKVVGMLLPDIENPVFPPIIRGIEEQLSAAGYALSIASALGDTKDQENLLEQMFARQVDGLILATAARQDPLVKRCLLEGVPVVLVNRAEEGGEVSEVVNDDFLSMKLAVDHLTELGHRFIAHLSGPRHFATGWTRIRGFEMAVREHGLEQAPIVECAAFTREAGNPACVELLRLYPEVTGIVAANDLIALGCYDALAQLHRHCPKQISIVGHNDIPLVDMLNPPLTTVRIQHREMGRQAARLLLERLSAVNTAPLRITLAPKLMVRGSTASIKKTS
jgi:LacI family transcriptional regulator